MAKADLLTPEQLRKLLDYNPETGALTWRERVTDSTNVDQKRAVTAFNSHNAGGPALRTADSDGYHRGKIFSRMYSAHRVIWAIVYGEWPEDQIDHINGVKSDNRIGNLRCVSRADNMRNRPLSSANKYGCPGIRPMRGTNWEARITHDSRRIHLGTFPTKEAAANARRAAERDLGFHPNHGRDK